MRLCTLRIGIHFLKDPGFRALLWWVYEILSMTYVVLKGYDPIDCVKPAVATESGKVYIYRKDSSFLFY